MTSGRDTTLRGTLLAGRTAVFDVGGDLLIQTLQHSSVYDSQRASASRSASPPRCSGVAVTGSLNASEQSIKHSHLTAVGLTSKLYQGGRK